MAEDPLAAMTQAAARDSQEIIRAKIDKERMVQTRARTWRRILRWSTFGFGTFSVGACALGVKFHIGLLLTLGMIALPFALLAALALFFMGGLAPLRAQAFMSSHERNLLND